MQLGSSRRTTINLTLTSLGALAGAAHAGDVKVIYTEIGTHSSGSVPGALDSAGLPVSTTWLAIEDLAVRADGGEWCIKGRTTQATTNDSILILGSSLSGTMFCQDGQPFKGGLAGELYDFFDSGPPICWDSANNIGFSARAKGGTTSIAEKVVRVIGGVHTILHKQSDPFPGLSDIVTNPTGDETIGNSIGSVTLLDDGTFLFGNTPIGNCSSFRYPAVWKGNGGFVQSGVTPITVLTGVGEIWDNFLYDGGGGTPDGMHWYWEGDTENASTAIDGIFSVDGTCIFQEGQPLLLSSQLYADTFQARMLSNGDWFARGDDTLDDDWAVRNGVLLAKTGDPIITGSTENWGVSFLAVAGNRVGDWLLCGNTNSIDPNADNVMVINGETVIRREGDPIDLDDNGLFDDNVFLASFQPNDVYLTDDGGVYYLATLRDGAGTSLGDAFLYQRTCGDVTAYGTGCAGSGGFIPSLALSGCLRSGEIATLDLNNALGGTTAILFFGSAQASIPMPGACTLLVNLLPGSVAFPVGGVGPGQGSISIPSLLPGGLFPVTFTMQAFTQDGGVFQGFANTNGLEVEFD